MTNYKFIVYVVRIIFSLWSWFEVFKETPAGELIEVNCRARLNCLKQLLDDVIFIHFNNKKLSHYLHQKINRMTDCCNKENDNGAKRCLRSVRRWQTTCWNWATPVWYCSIWESRSMELITVTCFCHNSCCLPYVIFLASLYFRKQCHNI